MIEKWKNIFNFKNIYQVSNFGRIRSLIRKTNNQYGKIAIIKKSVIGKYGYEKIILYKNGIGKTFLIHRLVANAFIKKIKGKNFINHKDCNRSNNKVSNLEWVTCTENQRYSWKIGNKEKVRDIFKSINKCGDKNPNSKLKNFQVKFILKNRYKYSRKFLSLMFNVSISSVDSILNKKTWNKKGGI